jgi:hypothetical protein
MKAVKSDTIGSQQVISDDILYHRSYPISFPVGKTPSLLAARGT